MMENDLSSNFIVTGAVVAIAMVVLALIAHRVLKRLSQYWDNMS